MKKLVLAFVMIGVSIASAKTYNLTLYQPSVVAGTELKPGDYKIDVQDNKAVIRNGKAKTEADVKVESNGQKYQTTTVRYGASQDGKYQVQEIRLGGTNMKLVFND